jgi:predicted hexulose-6-phosphate isomerase
MCLSGHRRYPLGSEDKDARARALAITAKALEMAAYLGVRVIQLAGYDVYYSASTRKTRALFADGLARVTEMAARHAVLLGFETMETPFMDTVSKAMKYVRSLRSPWLQIYPDIGNLTNAAALYGHDLYADIAGGRGHIVAAHLKESMPGRYREVPFGTGHVAFTPAIRALLRQGARIFVGECWHDGSRNWRTDLRATAAFLRGHIGSATGETAAGLEGSPPQLAFS